MVKLVLKVKYVLDPAERLREGRRLCAGSASRRLALKVLAVHAWPRISRDTRYSVVDAFAARLHALTQRDA